VLHMLRHVVGDETYFNIFHAYYADPRYKWKDVTTENFRDLCEEVSGMDLHGFFQDWIYGTYYPRYNYSFLSEPRGGNNYRVYVHVRQTQTTSPQTFRMPTIDLSIYNGSYTDVHVPMIDRKQDYVIDLNDLLSPPTSIAVDRNDWILKTAVSESYAVHVIYDTLSTGVLAISYHDSVIVRGGSKPYTYSVTSGSLPAELTLNPTTGIVSGTPTDTGRVTFTVSATGTSGGSDSKQITMRIAPETHIPGDANHDHTVDISDAVYLIAYIFSGGLAPVPMTAGDVNADCTVNISDAVYLIGYIFSGGPAPLPGC
jgi:hypothetical protein